MYTLLLLSTLIVILFASTEFFIQRKKKFKSQLDIHPELSHVQLSRSDRNPIMTPHRHHAWESMAVFNPAALFLDGRVHLLYRAMGPDGVSRIGYASSTDGVHFDKRSRYPVFVPKIGMGIPDRLHFTPNGIREYKGYNPLRNKSGGGWAGCEDPRIVHIDDTLYMTFVAFDGWGFIRMAYSTISVEHFLSEHWNWSAPVLISPENQANKNWVIFPEKINGKFAILHSISPRVQIEYVDSLDQFDGETFITSIFERVKNEDSWDTWIRGAGPPPIKTEYGWLLFYHTTTQGDEGRYKVGAVILDILDPTVVLYKSPGPVLTPEMWYENHGKDGVVYVSGAVVIDQTLFVYYGAGDSSICVATVPIEELCQSLINHSIPTIEIRDIYYNN